jgi:FixJ family two-component response regulator
MKTNIDSTVFIVDDDSEVRQGLKWLLETIKLKVEVYETAVAFLEAFNIDRKGCLVIDVRMPDMSGLELLEKLKLLKNRLPVIVITGHGDIPMAVRAIRAGAMDFLSKPFNDQQLLEQIQKVIANNICETKLGLQRDVTKNIALLTTREREIMNLIITGKLNKQIAHELDISISTVELHRSHLMRKMQVKTLAELVKDFVLFESEGSS